MLDGYGYRFLDIPRWNLRRPSTMRLRQSLRPLFRQTRATHVWVEGWRFPAFWQAVFQAKRSGIKVWCRGESNDLSPQPLPPKWWFKKILLGWFFRQVDLFLCIGSANQRLYLRSGVPSHRLAPAPYCVDNLRFASEAARLRERRKIIRSQWNIPEDSVCLLFAGKLIPKKRPLDIVAAIEALSDEWQGAPHFHILFAGSGALKAQLRARCSVVYDAEEESSDHNSAEESMGSRPAASFAGFLNQTEISQAYVAADCLVLPSDTGETWGLVVNEAMASGLPCVVSDACGCAEDLAAPLDPLLRYKCGDIRALILALRRVLRLRPVRTEIEAIIDRHHMRWTAAAVRDALQ